MDRRALFFLGAAVASAVLTPLADAPQRWVPELLAGIYVVLALVSFLDSRSIRGQGPVSHAGSGERATRSGAG